jgi:hypothetical protein
MLTSFRSLQDEVPHWMRILQVQPPFGELTIPAYLTLCVRVGRFITRKYPDLPFYNVWSAPGTY